jgi:hypothetical protein
MGATEQKRKECKHISVRARSETNRDSHDPANRRVDLLGGQGRTVINREVSGLVRGVRPDASEPALIHAALSLDSGGS